MKKAIKIQIEILEIQIKMALEEAEQSRSQLAKYALEDRNQHAAEWCEHYADEYLKRITYAGQLLTQKRTLERILESEEA